MILEIASRRLVNQRLTGTKFNKPGEVVHWLGAVQAQDYMGAKWAIGLRTNGLTDPDIDRAFADGSILRTHLLRPTWHFVTPEDIRWLLMLTGPRVHAANAFMIRKLEIDRSTIKQSYRTVEEALQGRQYCTRDELGSLLKMSGIHAEGQRLAYIMMSAELDGLVCSGPRKGKQFTYALLDERAPAAGSMRREDALAELTRRYFSTRGPATLRDFSWWSGLTLADARNGMEELQSEFVSEELHGNTYWFRETKLPPKGKSPTAYLLPNYDEYFIGFKDRGAISEVGRRAGIRKDDPALMAHILILNGQVVGGWRRTLHKDSVNVEASLIARLTRDEEEAVEEAVERFGEFLGLPATFTIKESIHG